MNKKAIVLLADGFEDVETVTPIDYLRRAGIEVTTVSISENQTVTSKWGGIKIIADTTIAQIAKHENANHSDANQAGWDAVVCPGGMPGASNLASSRETSELLKKMNADGKLICAICASPVIVLSPLGLIDGKNFTCYPGMEEKAPQGKWSQENVVIDANIITSRAAGTTGEFAIAIIEKLLDKETAKKIADAVLL